MEISQVNQFDAIFLAITVKGEDESRFFTEGYYKFLKLLDSKFQKERRDGRMTIWHKKDPIKDTARISVETHYKKILRGSDNSEREWLLTLSMPNEECTYLIQSYKEHVTTQFVFASSYQKNICTVFFETSTDRPLGANQEFTQEDGKEHVVYSTAPASTAAKKRTIIGVTICVKEGEVHELMIMKYQWTSKDNFFYKATLRAKQIFHSNDIKETDPAYAHYNKYIERTYSEMYIKLKKIT